MSIRQIHLLGSPTLRERASDVETVDDGIRELVQDLFDTMYADQGVGLAANQIGRTERVAVVDNGEDPPIVLINPVIVKRSGKLRAEEGCLSIPEIFADVDRAEQVTVETTTLDGERAQVEASELLARVIQHEVDHLDGILFLDHVSPLKRRMLIKKWRKMRKGESGYLKEVSPARVKD